MVVAEVVESSVGQGRRFLAELSALRHARVGSEVEGRIAERLVEDGDFVEEGTPLARLDDRAIKIELKAARAELGLRQHELEELQNGSRPEEIVAAQARYDAALDEEASRLWTLERTQELHQEGTLSEEDLRRATLAVRVARSLLAQRKAELELAKAGPRPEKIAQAEARVGMQHEQVALLVDRERRTEITAPFDGYVVQRLADVGAWLSKGSEVFELASLDPIGVRASVPEDFVVHLRPGNPVTVTVDALPGETFEGTISKIVPLADPRAKTFPVKIRLDNPTVNGVPRLLGGMSAQVSFRVNAGPVRRYVPKDALVLSGGRSTVYVVDSGERGGKVRPVAVVLGKAAGSWMEVEGELREGQLVVVRGNERLRPGQSVTILERLTLTPPEGQR